ncbi:MAG: DoxX family protein [Chitinophagaceae bacterium]|nr:DoxX family protein [Chitinophagaceae bacterium]
MKAIKITYWISTSIFALVMAFSAYNYVTAEAMKQGFMHLGYPDYFRTELAVAKVIGAILLLAPVGVRLKEWAYAGFTFTLAAAFIAHMASGDPVAMRVSPLVFMVLLALSYVTYHRLPKTAPRSSSQTAVA